MKRTHSANIGGTIFTIEEDAYEQLQDYLRSIESHFDSFPDAADIVADIEARIAEQLQQRDATAHVVRASDVERVIAIMGRTEQFADPVEEPPAGSQARKLFRDPDSKVIAGVAAGLAAYLGLPHLLVRLAFLVLAFFFGTAVVVYLLLWALVPMARSATDKLQMRGRPLTLASIDQGVRDGLASFPPATRNLATRSVLAAGSLINLIVVGIVRVLKWTVSVLVVGAATIGVLALSVLLVMTLVNAAALHPNVATFLDYFGGWQQAFKVFAYLLAIIPLALVIATALRLFWGVKHLNTRGLAGMLAVWVISLLGLAAIWSSNYPQLRDEYPASVESQRDVERIRLLTAGTSPLSEDQAKKLFDTLAAEHKRRLANEQVEYRYYGDARSRLESDEQLVRDREESNRRVLESAHSYLDAGQLASMQEFMNRRNSSLQAALQARRERLEARGW